MLMDSVGDRTMAEPETLSSRRTLRSAVIGSDSPPSASHMIVTMRASHTSLPAFSFPATSTDATAAANSGTRLPPQAVPTVTWPGAVDGEIRVSVSSP